MTLDMPIVKELAERYLEVLDYYMHEYELRSADYEDKLDKVIDGTITWAQVTPYPLKPLSSEAVEAQASQESQGVVAPAAEPERRSEDDAAIAERSPEDNRPLEDSWIL